MAIIVSFRECIPCTTDTIQSLISKLTLKLQQTATAYVNKLEEAWVTEEASYISVRWQGVVLPGVSPVWSYIRTGVSQRSILGPLLFLVFINGIVNGIDSNIHLFADDTCLFIIVKNAPYSATCLNLD